MMKRVYKLTILSLLGLLIFLTGCSTRKEIKSYPSEAQIQGELKPVGYSIQVGAYSKVENALHMTDILREHGIEAYYFRHKSGLYKVRFGEFSFRTKAEEKAQNLIYRNIIPEFFIIDPSISSPSAIPLSRREALRNNLVETAINYHGLPYCWGGTSPDIGFDCSGLAVAVYRLNGLALPRTCHEQYASGIPVSNNNIQSGDLVFFAKSGKKNISHVGIYVGNGKFIHASARNKKIRTDSLNHSYYRTHFVGARRYIR